LHRGGGSLLLSTATRFCLDASWNNFRDELFLDQTDELWAGDANLVYRFAQHPLVEFRSGIGMNWLADQETADFGFNFTYAFDVYPRKPWIVSAEIDWGWLGDTSLFHGRLTGGVLLDRFEFFAGFDYLDVGHAAFAGPLTGIRVWF
jgi:hypothetical protein